MKNINYLKFFAGFILAVFCNSCFLIPWEKPGEDCMYDVLIENQTNDTLSFIIYSQYIPNDEDNSYSNEHELLPGTTTDIRNTGGDYDSDPVKIYLDGTKKEAIAVRKENETLKIWTEKIGSLGNEIHSPMNYDSWETFKDCDNGGWIKFTIDESDFENE